MANALVKFELGVEDSDVWEYLQSFGEDERVVIIKSALRDQMAGANFESQILGRLDRMNDVVEGLQKAISEMRFATLTGKVPDGFPRGEFPEAEKNIDTLIMNG